MYRTPFGRKRRDSAGDRLVISAVIFGNELQEIRFPDCQRLSLYTATGGNYKTSDSMSIRVNRTAIEYDMVKQLT